MGAPMVRWRTKLTSPWFNLVGSVWRQMAMGTNISHGKRLILEKAGPANVLNPARRTGAEEAL